MTIGVISVPAENKAEIQTYPLLGDSGLVYSSFSFY